MKPIPKVDIAASKKRTPANRQLTKEKVLEAIEQLRKTRTEITTRALYDALGRKGSFSTLNKLKNEFQNERPELFGPVKISRSEVIDFINECDRSDLPDIEKAMENRRWEIFFWNGLLFLRGKDSEEFMSQIRSLRAKEDLSSGWTPKNSDEPAKSCGWTLDPTHQNFEDALSCGFVPSNLEHMRKELDRIARRNGWTPRVEFF